MESGRHIVIIAHAYNINHHLHYLLVATRQNLKYIFDLDHRLLELEEILKNMVQPFNFTYEEIKKQDHFTCPKVQYLLNIYIYPRGNWVKICRDSFYYLYNSLVNLKLFQNKNNNNSNNNICCSYS